MKQNKIIATDNKHLKILIEKEIEIHGYNCNLNHIDVSNVTDMKFLFNNSQFKGDISHWNVSNVTDMSYLFSKSQFNGDISHWNVSNVTYMNALFYSSQFNGDISNWNVSNVTNMNALFYISQFNGDLSNWFPVSLTKNDSMFNDCSETKPYWSLYDLDKGNEAMLKAINAYHFFNQLEQEIANKDSSVKKIKI